ncbi:NgoFVII family restriction endonuclease [Alkalibaculum sp. M08DMB]|uniref:NgoFVII family restriction endonuclease n=1 Tax=Alkalibaculum sporogenes TaxID=2655001 RepID=A0A6A7KC13_9FIRM|nr:DEAD/DEAH box helicase family protein [Alkalibaculum sporogenes]MPW27070.1 NgoFVII family restriction endonuclease [Alkalibaculum sporogenes]
MVDYFANGNSVTNDNCITGDKNHLYDYLKESILKAREIDINVSFLMESGVRLLINDLLTAIHNGAHLRILCGNYLNITQPQALYLLKDQLGDRVDLRFYNVPNKSFHAKAYFFKYDDYQEIFIGSSNISRSALTHGIEWNYRINSKEKKEDCAYFRGAFEDIFLNNSIIVDDIELRRYSKQWRRPKVFQQLEKIEDQIEDQDTTKKVAQNQPDYIVDGQNASTNIISFPQPIGAQIEALYELRKFREENLDKGIVVAATGIGKTFLAAFDSKGFKKILFVAHRDEILQQAENTFKCIRPELSMGHFSGSQKDLEQDIIFASVQTLGKKEYLIEAYFKNNVFDYIIIDEFHHAVADHYTNIIEYFRPKFLLGLTATPERLDNKDVFALCDYNIVYEVRLKEAINKGWLVPFRYYGIYDETDYNSIDYINGRYKEDQLEKLVSINIRADLIYQNYLKYNSKKALGFCTSRNHALYMTNYFSEKGIQCCAVISGTIEEHQKSLTLDRTLAIQELKRGNIKLIFSVDMFNEGLDIPELDMVLFLRPTQSPTIFLQQLGRGLRKSKGKNYINVLDFIGNYKKANLVPFFLTGDSFVGQAGGKTRQLPEEEDYPEDCYIDFDFRLIDLFKKMAQEQKKIKDLVLEEYNRIKTDVDKRPMRSDMYVYIDDYIYANIRSKRDVNIFKDYLSFIDKINETTDDEKRLIGTIAHDFLKEIENTAMSKTYKMPILLAFYNKGNMKLKITEDDIYRSFKEFYSHGSNLVDLLRDKSTADAANWGKKEYVSLANRNPVRFLAQPSSRFFYKEGDLFCLTSELGDFVGDVGFVVHFKDVVDYRVKRFYKERLEKI